MGKKKKGNQLPEFLAEAQPRLNQYNKKQMTDKHKETMLKIAEDMIDEGFTPDDIIDVGDWILEEISLAQLLGEEKIEGKALVKEAKENEKANKSNVSSKGKSGKGGKGEDSKKASKSSKASKGSKAKESKKAKGKGKK